MAHAVRCFTMLYRNDDFPVIFHSIMGYQWHWERAVNIDHWLTVCNQWIWNVSAKERLCLTTLGIAAETHQLKTPEATPPMTIFLNWVKLGRKALLWQTANQHQDQHPTQLNTWMERFSSVVSKKCWDKINIKKMHEKTVVSFMISNRYSTKLRYDQQPESVG